MTGMEVFAWGACAVCVCLLAALVKRGSKETALLMSATAAVVLLLGALGKAQPLFRQLEGFSGQSGLLFNKLRDEQGLGYTVTAFYRSLPEAGFMAFYIGTTPRNLDVARQGFSGIIKDIKTDLLPAELLAKGLNRMEGSYYRGRQSLGARADEAASERLLGQPQDFQKRLLEKAAKVTPEQLREVARKYLLVDKMYEVTLLP